MARRWLRSPRIRNTFMVPRAGGPHPRPRTARGQLLGNFLAGEAAATSPGRALGPALRAPRSPPAPPPLRQRTLGRAVTWPGRQPCRASQEAPPPEIPPPSRPSAAAPGPPARDLGRATAPLPPPGAPSSASRVYNSGARVDGGGGGARASVWPKPRGLAAPRECDPLPLSASAWGSRPPSFPALLPVHCQSPLVLTRPVGAVKLVKDGPQVWGQADLCSGLSAVGLPLPLLASGVSSVKGGC
ncbi:formin-like protein 5 isoform X2 [Leopardus geoffroyi]|nr:formin-like protein 5 isoform X2 [Leopardus geoffroyi]